MVKVETVSIIYKHPKILLGMKKVRFGRGKYNGFGGGVENGEGLLESAIRETEEESGIIMINPIKMGEILFHFQSDEEDHYVHFFKATQFKGVRRETEEMKPKWFNIKKIPYKNMWPDDKYWMPFLLSDIFFIGKFEFDLKGKIAKYELNEVSKKRLK